MFPYEYYTFRIVISYTLNKIHISNNTPHFWEMLKIHPVIYGFIILNKKLHN